MALPQSNCEAAAMLAVNVSVGSFLLPCPPGVLATKVYEMLNYTHGVGALIGPDGILIFNENNPLAAGNYTYRVASPEVVPREGAPRFKKPKRSQDNQDQVCGEVRYFEKLLEPPAVLPRTAAELERFLGQVTVKLPVRKKIYKKVKEPTLLTEEFPEEVIDFAVVVEYLLKEIAGDLNEATSSSNLHLLSGKFIKQLNELAPLSRRLDNMLVLLDSANPTSGQTASKPLERLARPDMQLFVRGCLILRWENKVKYDSLPEAVGENCSKLKAWSPLFYGALPYVIGGCCAGNQFRWLRLCPDDKGRIKHDFISRSYDLNSMKDVAAFLCCNIRMHCLLQKLQKCLIDPIRVLLYQPMDRGDGVTVTIHPDVVRKEIRGDDTTLVTRRQSLYESIVHSKYLIHGKVRRTRKATVLDLKPVGDPHSEPVTLEDLEYAAHDIVCGLNDLHKAGYTHRDIRWENCIKVNVMGEWKWMLIDLESAGSDGEEWNNRQRLRAWDDDTLEGTKMKYTKASDLYLLGKLIDEWQAGRPQVDDKLYQLMKSRAEKMKERALTAVEVKKLFCKRSCKRCKKFGGDN